MFKNNNDINNNNNNDNHYDINYCGNNTNDNNFKNDDNKQIITIGEGDGTNYHFQGDLDVAIFPKRS